jgi:4-hydroxy-2-oxovalerate aldolase
MTSVTICDSTLRDGSHPMRHQYTREQVVAVAGALDRAGVDIIEVSHGDGLGGSSLNYGRSAVDEFELIEAAMATIARARLAVLLLPGIGIKEDLERARAAGATVARIATHVTEADIAESHIALAREFGFTVVGFLMMAHMAPPEVIAEQGAIMEAAGAHVVYVTDSAGALVPDGARARVAGLRHRLTDSVAVGFHAHQSLSLAVGNTLAAISEGATWVDGCTCGLGAGAGNAPTEALVAALVRSEVATGVDPVAMMDVADDVVRPLMPRAMLVDRASLLLGYAGVYSSFLLHAERASERFGVSVPDLLVEVGRRQAVGGQEDLLIDIAAEIAAARA